MVRRGGILSWFFLMSSYLFYYNIDIKDQKIKLPLPTQPTDLLMALWRGVVFSVTPSGGWQGCSVSSGWGLGPEGPLWWPQACPTCAEDVGGGQVSRVWAERADTPPCCGVGSLLRCQQGFRSALSWMGPLQAWPQGLTLSGA